MSNNIISISAKCRNNPDCRFTNEIIFIDISIKNNSRNNLSLPLLFLINSGPVIELTDRRTGKKSNVPTGLANLSLKTQLETLRPNESVTLEWAITEFDIQQFNSTNVDIDAEITIFFEGKCNGEPIEVIGRDTIHITNKE